MSVRNKYNKISTTKTQQQCLVILHQSHNQFSLIQFERCLKFYSNVSKNPTLGIKFLQFDKGSFHILILLLKVSSITLLKVLNSKLLDHSFSLN